MRIAVVFFGIARSVPVTIETLKRQVYGGDPAGDISFRRIASLNLVGQITNPRTGETGVVVDEADAFLLDADAYALVRQDDAAIANALTAARRQPDLFDNGWISVRNALHQLASLRRAWTVLAQMEFGGFDHVLFVRPDLLYLDQFNLRGIVAGFTGQANIALPSWHSFGGFNDRFALADPAAARHYASRLNLVEEFCEKQPFHPETFLAYALAKGHCHVCDLPVRASRVRAQGTVKQEDFRASVANLPATPKPFFIQSRKLYVVDGASAPWIDMLRLRAVALAKDAVRPIRRLARRLA